MHGKITITILFIFHDSSNFSSFIGGDWTIAYAVAVSLRLTWTHTAEDRFDHDIALIT